MNTLSQLSRLTTVLYRPVGPTELALIAAADWQAFIAEFHGNQEGKGPR